MVAGRAGPRAASSAEDVGEDRQAARARVDCLEDEGREGDVARSDCAVRQQVAECPYEDIRQPLHGEVAGTPAAGKRGWGRNVPFGARDLDVARQTVVLANLALPPQSSGRRSTPRRGC